MGKITIVLLALLSSDAFALDAFEAKQAADHDKWQKEAEARRDELMRNYNAEHDTSITCVDSVEAQATEILGDYSRKYIDIFPDSKNRCWFTVKKFGEFNRGCENLSRLSAIAIQTDDQAEICRYESEVYEVYVEYRDIMFTDAYTDEIQQEYQAKLKPIAAKHMQNMIKLNKW